MCVNPGNNARVARRPSPRRRLGRAREHARTNVWVLGTVVAALIPALAFAAPGELPRPAPSAVAGLPAPLTTAAAVRALSLERAEQALHVSIRGVITCAGVLTFIQDQTAGIFVDVPVSMKGRYQVGQYGELEGFTAPGLFAPQIVPRKFTVLGKTPLPAARPAKFDELFTGRLDSQRVEVTGIIRAVMPDERPDLRRTVTLKMASDDGVFPITVPDLSPEKLRAVVDASVRVRGVVGGVFNERRQMIGIKVYLGQADDLVIEKPGPAEPYALNATPVEHLLRFQPEGTTRHRVKVSGVVTLFQPGVAFYVQDASGGVAVRTRQTDPLAVGDRVDVLGFPQMGAWTPYLDDAIFRHGGAVGEPVTPVSVTADQELSTGAHDARLVRLEAEVVDLVADVGRVLLVAKSKNVLFDAELLRPLDGPAAPVPSLKNGSRVRLTGISVVRLQGERDHPTHFRLLLRGVDDITVLQQPSWWTLGRLMWLLVALASVAAFAVGWGVALRRRVRAQTGIIRQQVANESTLEARYRELFDNANDIVYTHDTDGRLLTVNRAGEQVTGYTRDELLRKSIFELALPARRELLAEWLRRVSTGEVLRPTFEWELIAKDGRLVPLEISVRALMEGGRVRAIEGIARDITERKRAELELGAAQQRLVDASRRAGMAEVAAGVLHNVGNVLTSVTTSAGHLAEQLRTSNAAQLASVLATLRAHASDLPDFLASDPRGRELPAQLVALAEELTGEHALIAREVEALGRSVEHIKEIIAVQQGYARGSGVRAEVSAETLIEDALRINREALERHRIEVTREFAPAPPLMIEKHKVLEILVNLLSNAKYACDARPAGPVGARITVRIDTPKGERAGDRVRLVVADNGIGIPHDHLTRIFDQGFSTRQDGNGLGLHTAWTTARELGGSLFVHSDGVGKGARFTLDLPVRPSDERGSGRMSPPGGQPRSAG